MKPGPRLLRFLALTCLWAIAAVSIGCGAAASRSPAPSKPATGPVFACIAGEEASGLPSGVSETGADLGACRVVQGSPASLAALPPPWRVVVRFGPQAAYAKVRNWGAVVAAQDGGFEAFVGLSPVGTSLTDEALGRLLSDAGFVMVTRAGDVVTGRASMGSLDKLLQLDAVASLRAAAKVDLRAE